jgi:hypothetical protein
MPNIKKAEYESLKSRIALLEDEVIRWEVCWEIQKQKADTWKRYYDAFIEVFKVEETVDIPGCFNPMDAIEYIVKMQTEVDEFNRIVSKMK